MALDKKEKSFLKKIIPAAAFLGGLCCFTPLVLALLGLSSIAFAASLSDVLYGGYRWVFRSVALLFLIASLVYYFYKKEGICSLDAVKRKRRKIINLTLLTLVIGVVAYIIWLYVIVEIVGLLAGVW